MNDLTLVVMAAGMGSRFGGLKQMEPVDEDGNFLLDYSVYDAKRAGFNKVVFVIKEELYADFVNTVGKRLDGVIDVSYAFQRIDDIFGDDKSIIKERSKPWGTAQAIYVAKDYVSSNFAVINADDFYGYDAYKQVVDFFNTHQNPYEYVSVPYPFIKTASASGSVKRGVIDVRDGYVNKIIECSIASDSNGIVASPLDGSASFSILPNDLVSMNMFGFSYDFFGLLESYLQVFFSQSRDKLVNGEALLPDCLALNLASGKIKIRTYPTNSEWIGMTYRDDLPLVISKIKALRDDGVYPSHLWDKGRSL